MYPVFFSYSLKTFLVLTRKRNTRYTRRFLYLIKEPCSVYTKVYLWIIAVQLGVIYHLLFDYSSAIVIGALGGIPLWLAAERLLGYYKIGITNHLKRRLTAINNGNARRVYYKFVKRIDEAGVVEKKIHKELAKNRKEGEWFYLWFWQVWVLWLRYFR